MAERDPNLYFSTRGPFTVNAVQPVTCALGQIIYAGTKWNSGATYDHAPPPDYMRPTPHFLLVLTLEGEADYIDSTGMKTILRPGTLIWAAPGVDQSYGPRKSVRWSELFVWFSGPVFDAWHVQGWPGNRTRQISVRPLDYWVKRLRAIVDPGKAARQETHLGRLCQFQQFLADALPFDDGSRETSESVVWKEKAARLLTSGNLNEPQLEEVASELNMSYSAFRKRFQQITGKTPGKFRTEEVIRQACKLLLETDESLAEVALKLGFHDAFHFSRRFKQSIGMGPKSFRQQHSTRRK